MGTPPASPAEVTAAPPPPQSHGPAARVQLVLACLMMAVTGSVFSVAVFTIPIELTASPPGSLDGVWPRSTGLINLISAPLMILSGVHLSRTPRARRTAAARAQSWVAVAGFAAFATAAPAVASGSLVAIGAAVSALAVPLGIYALLLNELVVQWMPGSAGFAVGLLAFSVACGTAGSAAMFNKLIDLFDVGSALMASAVILAVLAAIPTVFLRFPPSTASSTPAAGSSSGEQQGLLPLPSAPPPPLSLPVLLRLPSFWLYIAGIVAGTSSYALIPYFFKIGDDYGQPRPRLVSLFQAFSLLAMFASVLVPALTPRLAIGSRGLLSSGSRNTMAASMLFQAVALISLSATSFLSGNSTPPTFTHFATVALVCRALVQVNYACVVLLAIDMFGARNSALVYGTGGGLALGTSESLSVFVMSAIENMGVKSGKAGPGIYTAFYAASAVCNVLGFVATAALRRLRKHTDCDGGEDSGEMQRS